MKHVVTICGKVGWDRVDRVLASEPDARWILVTDVEDVPPRGLTDTFNLSLRSVAQYEARIDTYARSPREEALDLATSIGNAEIAPGTSLKLHLFYKWFSLWWIMEPALREHLTKVVEAVRHVRLILDAEKPDKVYAFGKGRQHIFSSEGNLLDPEVVVAVARQRGIDGVRVKPTARSRPFSAKLVLPSFIRFILWAGSMARRVVYRVSGWFKPVGQERAPRRTIAVVSDHLNWRTVAEPREASAGKNDAVVGGVLNELSADASSRALFADFLSLTGLGLRAIAEKSGRFARIDYRPLEAYVRKQVLKDVWMHAHLFRSKWDEVKNLPALSEAASVDGVELWEAIRTKMEFFFLFWLPMGTYYADAMASFIRHEKPDVIVVVGEQRVYGRCFLAAAQAMGVPTAGMQRGVISRDHRQYTHSADEVPRNGRFVGTTLCPIPDKTAVYGELFKRTLVDRGGYPPDSVVVTGQPSYDFLYNTRDNDAKERICRQLDIDPEKQIVVLATQTHHGFSDYQNRLLLETVFDAMLEFPENNLVVKLHPAEDPALHRRVASEKRLLDEVVIVKDVNLFDLLQASEVLITAHSTVALEAMLFGKPVVTVNVTGTPDVMPYAESGAAVSVSDAAELVRAIRAVLTDENVRRRLAESRNGFLADCLHPVDGKAARRVVDLALGMVKDSPGRDDEEPQT